MPSFHQLSVLVVDDCEDCAQSTADLLSLSGHRVRVAACAADGRREAADGAPDVVLLDIGLPDLDGWEVARWMREQAAGGRQPFIVAVTGYGADGDRWKSADSGIDMHLVKPVEPSALLSLLARVREILAEHRADAASSEEPL
jgi:DNA-binding response OmpR family regulator